MLKNYFNIARRNLLRNKAFTLTNLLGLTIGMVCTILIFIWVKNELTYDKFHVNYKHIYQVIANRDFKNQIFTDQNMVYPLAMAIKSNQPQVENAVVRTHERTNVLSKGEVKLVKRNYVVSEDFFKMFSWKFIKGNPATAIKDPSSIVLTQSTATAIFGDEDPINQTVKVDNELNYKVTAVVEDVPLNSTMQFDFVTPFNSSDPEIKKAMDEWTNSSWIVYLQITPGANLALIEQAINKIKKQHDSNDAISTYFAFPMNKWHLSGEFEDGKNIGGMIDYVILFSIIAVIILLIACVNFMNLSTARSEKRSKEVGIRKTLGSQQIQLILQFFFESMILAFIAFVLAIATVFLILPSFNQLVGKELSIGLSDTTFWIASVLIIVFTGIIAGSYPAIYLSSFNPVKVLKGTFLVGKNAALPRRILVIGQFVASILLISATIIVYMQIQHIKDRDLGYNPDNLITVPATPEITKNYAVIKEKLFSKGVVKGIARSLSPITEIWWRNGSPEWEGKSPDLNIIVTVQPVDEDFNKTTGTRILQGKDFSGMPADSSHMILNKAAIEAMGLKDPIGMKMRFIGKDFTISGITDNIVVTSPFIPVDPMVMVFDPNNSGTVTIKLNPALPIQQSLKAIESVFKTYNPSFPFEYKFTDQEFAKKFENEELIGKLTNIFAGLAILICCMGLAGLASFTIEKRIREIGIRKVLGSSVPQLLILISKEFINLVMIALAIAVPLTWLLMNMWLQNYTYHISISIWVFIGVGFIILLLTLLVVGVNTLKAAFSNPIKNLRTE